MNKERIGEIRFGDEINENIIEVTPNEEEAVDLENSEAVFQALNSEDPLKTLDVLFEFTKEPENCELFIEALPLFLKTFDALSKNENPKISDLGKRIIVNLYTVTSGTELVRPQQAAYEFLMSIGTPENEDFPLFISLLLTLVSRSITIKQYMMKIGLLDMFVAIDPSTVPEDSLLEYTKIITYFLLLASNMSASTRLDLMDRLRLLIANCEDPQITNECLNAIDRVTNDVANTSSFISSETFAMIVSKYDGLDCNGRSSALSIFSHCYGCSIPELRQHAMESFPLALFVNELDNEEEIVRVNAAISLINCFRNEPSTVPYAFDSGIVNTLLEHLAIDNFETRKLLIRALYVCAESSNVEQFPLFETEEFIEVIKEIANSDDEEANIYIAQFIELYRTRSTEDDSPHVFDFIDEFMMDHDVSPDSLRLGF